MVVDVADVDIQLHAPGLEGERAIDADVKLMEVFDALQVTFARRWELWLVQIRVAVVVATAGRRVGETGHVAEAQTEFELVGQVGVHRGDQDVRLIEIKDAIAARVAVAALAAQQGIAEPAEEVARQLLAQKKRAAVDAAADLAGGSFGADVIRLGAAAEAAIKLGRAGKVPQVFINRGGFEKEAFPDRLFDG